MRKHYQVLGFALSVCLVAASPAPTTIKAGSQNNPNPIINALSACLAEDGIRNVGLDSIRVSGSTAVVKYEVGDGGMVTSFLVLQSGYWRCLGGTGGIPGKSTYTRIAVAAAARKVTVAPSDLEAMNNGTRGTSILRASTPIPLTTQTAKPRQ